MRKNRDLSAFCDGGARGNPGPGAAGCVIKAPAENMRVLCGKYLGVVTNNQAEYAAVELGLNAIKETFKEKRKINFFLDSKLVVSQLNGLYKVKNPSLRDTVLRIHALENLVGEVYYHHVSREKNQEADGLVNNSIDRKQDFRIKKLLGKWKLPQKTKAQN
jgi:ribonuclease HI